LLKLYLSSNPGIQIFFILATKRNKYLRIICMIYKISCIWEKSVNSETRYILLVVKGGISGTIFDDT
jgi:hypothetical protein